MTKSDDADDDLDDLKPLRAVWLEMRDEEPSGGGMAALLAAARVKADEMKATVAETPPSLWQRFLATFKRPPVLALATVVVLVSGAIVIGNRRDEMSAPAHRSEVVPTAQPTEPTVGSAMDSSMYGSAAIAVDEFKADTGKLEFDRAGGAPEKPAVPKPAAKKPGGKVAKDPVATQLREQTVPPTDDAEAEERVETGTATGEAVDADANAVGGAAVPAAPTTTSPAKPTKAGSRSSQSVQLEKQSETAAARGDCPAVRVSVEKLEKIDRPAKDSLVARNATVKRCLHP